MKTKAFLLPLALCAIILSAFAPVQNKEKVKGSGNIKKESRETSKFDGVATSGNFKVYVKQGNTNSVQIEADDNLLSYIETEVEDGSLGIQTKKGYSLNPSKPINVYIVTQNLNQVAGSGNGGFYSDGQIRTKKLEVSLSGSHEVNMDVDASALEVNNSGSSSIKLKGKADKVEISLSGNGSVDAQSLSTNTSEIAISGNGTVNIRAEKKLDVAISGAGNVTYSGNAAVSQSVSGRGVVKKQG